MKRRETMRKMMIAVCIFVAITIGSVSVGFAANINLYDPDGGYYHGTVNGGNVSLYDEDGRYYYGRIN
tara:strand:- start:1980 stop:2183 length:204 start_codon:yes stop_codon:yes gene_type:complete